MSYGYDREDELVTHPAGHWPVIDTPGDVLRVLLMARDQLVEESTPRGLTPLFRANTLRHVDAAIRRLSEPRED